MREIKFRGQDEESKNWVYGFYYRIQNDDSTYSHEIIEDTTMHQFGCRTTQWAVNPKTVGQYLGIKDMAGNEVFEGDILKEESGSKTRISDGKKFPQYSSETIEILFKDGNFKERVIAHENSYFGKIPSKPVDIKSWMITKAFKIIGNIHDTSKTQ
jgi:uncharacterized phage protein (TIGR01671 family)